MDYLRVKFKDNNKYYGDFIMKNSNDNINKILLYSKKSQGIIITDILDCLFIETKNGIINKAYDTNIINKLKNNDILINKELLLCVDECCNKNEIITKLKSLLIDCTNIEIVTNIEDLDKEVELNVNENEPLFDFSNVGEILSRECKTCHNYNFICEGEKLCEHNREITRKELYSKMYLEKIRKDLEYNDFILMRMFNLDDELQSCLSTINEYLIKMENHNIDKNKKESYIKDIKEDIKKCEYAINLTDKEVKELVNKYDFDNKMYTNFKFDDTHSNELDEYYFKILEEKLNNLKNYKDEREYEKMVYDLPYLDKDLNLRNGYFEKDEYQIYFDKNINQIYDEFKKNRPSKDEDSDEIEF